MKNKETRKIKHIINGKPTSDGDGVQLTRVIGTHELNMLDPFLLLDEFGSDKPLDYIGGFPAHPHRGFETVTYMIAGQMRHKDSAGNSGVIKPGDIQWMTAGKGIIHSEMPEQTDGLLAGLQLWINLPASQKMTDPKYQEVASGNIPVEVIEGNGSIKIIAGRTKNNTIGVIKNNFVDPTYWDVQLNKNGELKEYIDSSHNAFVYVLSGKITLGTKEVQKGQLAILTQGNELIIKSEIDSRFIVVAGKPLNEPVARGGPFVMNTQEQIQQAFADYKNGTLV